MDWPTTPDVLEQLQRELATETPPPWQPPADDLRVGGCFVAFPRGHRGPGAAGDPAWAAAVVTRGARVIARHVVTGVAGWRYEPGLLALRVGELLADVVRGLAEPPHVLLVDATGRDHPRRAGLAVHLGATLDLPTVGVTHRPLIARGAEPSEAPGAATPLLLGDETVGCWLRTRRGARPLAVHAGWRVDAATAVAVVRRSTYGHRTPEPLRQARRLARTARTQRNIPDGWFEGS